MELINSLTNSTHPTESHLSPAFADDPLTVCGRVLVSVRHTMWNNLTLIQRGCKLAGQLGDPMAQKCVS